MTKYVGSISDYTSPSQAFGLQNLQLTLCLLLQQKCAHLLYYHRIGLYFLGYYRVSVPCINLQHIANKGCFRSNIEDKRLIGAAFDVGITLLSISLVEMTSFVTIGPYKIVSPSSFPLTLTFQTFFFGCLVPQMKFWMKPPTLGLPMSTQIAAIAKVLVTTWVYSHSLIAHVLLFVDGFLLPAGRFSMASHSIKGTNTRVSTVINLVAFLPVVETSQRWFIIPLWFVLVLVGLFAWSPNY